MRNYFQNNAGKLVTLFRRELSQQMYSLTLSATRTAAEQLSLLFDFAAKLQPDATPSKAAISKAQHATSILIQILRPLENSLLTEFTNLTAQQCTQKSSLNLPSATA